MRRSDRFFSMMIVLAQILIVIGFTAFPASALVITYSKDGNDFSVVEGPYATSDHCIGETCNWIAGN